jgi:hypothetical protein
MLGRKGERGNFGLKGTQGDASQHDLLPFRGDKGLKGLRGDNGKHGLKYIYFVSGISV